MTPITNRNRIGDSGIYQFERLTLVFLPPNMTSLHQPIDMGMVRSFKCIYRRYQLRALLKAFDSHRLTTTAKFSTTKNTSMN